MPLFATNVATQLYCGNFACSLNCKEEKTGFKSCKKNVFHS